MLSVRRHYPTTLSPVAIVAGVVVSIRFWLVPPKRPGLCARTGSSSTERGEGLCLWIGTLP